ncbi:helix-turn-helix domain-containing protein [Phytoactinopolyspora limicola]|uniref:helix-turn-helix domain-containing protein n=1 Tax=Phytoactinopolyspora limicola TaxID=2715536 RepID=UPI001A9C5C23|nr:helix-turn-helix domain-containing protein [Phytoactinopolyspora limicola]
MGRDTRELAGAWTTFQQHSFADPSPDLAPYVERYWMVSWDYEAPYRQLIVPYPNVHLTFRDTGAAVHGVASRHQMRVLDGQSAVFGVAFRPGCFRPFLGAAVATITDRSLPATEVFDPALPDPPTVETVERFLRDCAPVPDPRAAEAADIVAMIAARRELTRVDGLARRCGMTVRQLQRLFAEYVGIGPKWVIRRYRLHEVTERLAAGATIDWAELAVDLGYADQAHFVRDFKRMFGESPTWYAGRYGA